MTEAHLLVMRRAVYLWIGTGLLMSFNIFAATRNDLDWIYAAPVATAVFALIGIAVGIWAARTITGRAS